MSRVTVREKYWIGGSSRSDSSMAEKPSSGSAVYDYAAMKLTEAGIPPEYQLTLLNTLEAFATGSVLYGLSPPAAAWEASLPPDGCEHLRLALRSDTLDEDARFELGCRALLEGLAAQLGRA